MYACCGELVSCGYMLRSKPKKTSKQKYLKMNFELSNVGGKNGSYNRGEREELSADSLGGKHTSVVQ